jgi:hypothetical protein
MGISSMPASVTCAASNDSNLSMGRVTCLAAQWSCSTALFTHFTYRMVIQVPCASWSRLMAAASVSLPSLVIVLGTEDGELLGSESAARLRYLRAP